MSLMEGMQDRIKTGSGSALVFLLKLVSGLFLGLTITLIGQEIFAYGNLAFWFVMLLVTAVFLKIAKPWGAWPVLIFDLICFLVGLLLKLYIQVSPG